MKATRRILAALAAPTVIAGTLAGCSSPPRGASPAASPLAGTGGQSLIPAMNAEQVARAMGIKHFTAYTAKTDPNQLLGRHGEYTSKVNWGPGGDGGDNSIEAFSTVADAEARYEYVHGFRCPFGDGYDLLTGKELLRLACSLTPAQAKPLEAKFAAVTGKG